jgi:signal transduction histidine kinase
MIGRSFHSLRARLVLLTLLALAPVLVVALVNARQNRRDTNRDVRRTSESAARLASSGVEQRLEAARQLLLAFSHDPAIVAAPPARCATRLARELREVGVYLNFAVLDTRGMLVCAARPPGRPGDSLAGANWFRAATFTRRPALGDDPVGALALRPALVIANPFRRPGGRGVVAAVLDLNQVRPILSAIDLPPGATLTEFEPDGRILARFPHPGPYVGHRFPEAGLVRAGRADPSGARDAHGLDGVERIYGFSRVDVGGSSQVVVAVGLSKSRAQAAANRTLRRTLITLLLVALGATALVLVASHLFVVRPVRLLSRASRRIAAGDLDARSGVPTGGGEVGELAAAFDEMASTLQTREREIRRSTTERQRLLAELVSAEEEERNRIAEDIHDDSLQALGALLLRLEIIESRLDDPVQRASLGDARESARDSVTRLRHLMFKLHPPALESDGLVSALEGFVHEVSRVSGATGDVVGELEREPSYELGALAYRVAAEAINNAAKHAKASRIAVTVQSRHGGVQLRVSDDGAGFDPAAAQQPRPGHLGLVSMRERAEAAGGWWSLASEPGKGTVVEFWMPDGDGAGAGPG